MVVVAGQSRQQECTEDVLGKHLAASLSCFLNLGIVTTESFPDREAKKTICWLANEASCFGHWYHVVARVMMSSVANFDG